MSTRLLIVDDQPNARELIRTFLTMPGIIFQECASGNDAVACVQEFKPHWITMDIQMPGMNGFEAIKAIKKAHPEAHVIIVTSFNEPQYRDLARSAGASAFILKENLLALRLMLERESKNTNAPSSPAGGAGQAKRILVVDDDKEIQAALGELLTAEGHQVTFAMNGLEALSLHRQSAFDLVVIELLLAGNEGFETLAELRRIPSPPKFIATAKSSWMPVHVYSKMAKQLGVQATLAKPFLPDQLLTAVRSALTQ